MKSKLTGQYNRFAEWYVEHIGVIVSSYFACVGLLLVMLLGLLCVLVMTLMAAQ